MYTPLLQSPSPSPLQLVVAEVELVLLMLPVGTSFSSLVLVPDLMTSMPLLEPSVDGQSPVD